MSMRYSVICAEYTGSQMAGIGDIRSRVFASSPTVAQSMSTYVCRHLRPPPRMPAKYALDSAQVRRPSDQRQATNCSGYNNVQVIAVECVI